MKNLWALRYVFVMLVVFATVVACSVWLVRAFPVYVCASILLIVAAAIIDRPNAQRREERIKAQVEDALHRSYTLLSIPPKLTMSWSYGFRAFEVSFGSKREMEAATACNAAFKEEIAMLFKSPSWCKGWGPFLRPFSANQAISFTYEGYLDELRAYYKKAEPGASNGVEETRVK